MISQRIFCAVQAPEAPICEALIAGSNVAAVKHSDTVLNGVMSVQWVGVPKGDGAGGASSIRR